MKKKRAAPARKKAVVMAPVPAAARPQPSGGKPSMAVAVIALLINILLIPGLGTIVGGRMKQGLVQLLLLWLGGIIVTFLGFFLVIASPMAGLVVAMLGSIMVLSGWVWAIVSGVLIVRDASS